MKATRLTIILLAAAGLSACQTMSQTMNSTWDGIKNFDLGTAQTNEQKVMAALPEVVCPQVKIVDELSSLSEFSDLSDTADYNLISKVSLAQTESNCVYDGNNAVVDLKLVFEGQLGAKGRAKPGDTPTFSYPFFIAVTDADGGIKAKEIFGASLTYAAGTNGHTYYESLRQIIPVANNLEARSFNVLIGFQLTPEQLRHNRANITPVREEARRLEESLKEQVQMGSNSASTPLGLTAAAGQPGIKITPGYPAASAAALAPAALAPVTAPAPVKTATAKAPAKPRTVKNPPLDLVNARKPARSAPVATPEPAAAAPAPAPAPEAAPAPAPVTEPVPAPAPAQITEPAPSAAAPAPTEPVTIPGGETVAVPTTPAAPTPAPATPPVADPAAPVAPAPVPAAPAAPADPTKKEGEKGAMNDKAKEMQAILPAAGSVVREAISTIDLTAPIE